jgi:hypothetical protein
VSRETGFNLEAARPLLKALPRDISSQRRRKRKFSSILTYLPEGKPFRKKISAEKSKNQENGEHNCQATKRTKKRFLKKEEKSVLKVGIEGK